MGYAFESMTPEEILGTQPKAPTAPPTPASAAAGPKYAFESMSPDEILGVKRSPEEEFARTSALFNASFENGDEEGKKRKLAADIERITGAFTPPSILDVKQAEQQRRYLEADHATRASPRTSAFLSVPENAAVALDDAKTMAQIERVLDGIPNFARNVVKGAGPTAAQGFWGALAAPFELADWAVQKLGVPPEMLQRTAGKGLRALSNVAKETGNRMDIPEPQGWLERDIMAGAESLGTNLAVLPFGVAARSSEFALGSMSAISGGQSYLKASKEGADPLRGLALALPDATAEYVTEKIGLKALFDSPAFKNAFLKQAAKFTALEMGGEQIATVWQDFNEWMVLNPGKSLDTFLAERPEAARSTAIATLIGAGGQVAVVKGAEAVLKQTAAQDMATADASRLGEVFARANEMLLRERDPVTFGSFFQSLAPDATVFIDTERFRELMSSGKVDSAKLPSVTQEALAESTNVGPGVEIPVHELVSAFAGTGLENDLVQHVRMAPNAETAAEATAKGAEAMQLLDNEVRTILQEKMADAAFVQSADEVKQDIEQRLSVANPLGAQYGSGLAKLLTAWYVTQAKKWGVTPTQLRDGWTDSQGNKQEGFRPVWAYGDQPTLPAGFDHGNAMLNVGLTVGMPAAGSQAIDADFVKAEIEKFGVKVLSAEKVDGEYKDDNGNTVKELTYVPQLSRPLTSAEMLQLTEATKQEAIPQFYRGAGELHGTPENVAKYGGAFNGDYFKNQTGEALGAAPESFGQKAKKPKKATPTKPVPAETAKAASINNALAIAATGKFDYIRDLKEQIQNAVRESAQGADLSATTAEVRKYLTDLGTQEALAALETNANAIGWYDEKTRQALSVVALIHPEILTNPDARFTFIYALAVTSNGQKVLKNFELAERAYSEWKSSGGTMPSNVGAGGPAGAKVHEALARYNDLVKHFGSPAAVEEFMLTEFTAKELEAQGFNAGGENVDTVVLGAAILGPKIGNGFFANLYGVFNRLTMDRWLMRTWGRWTGTLLKDNQAAIKDEVKVLKALVKAVRADKEANAAMRQAFAMSTKGVVDKALLKASASPWDALVKAGNYGHIGDKLYLKSTYPAIRKVLQSSVLLDELRRSGNRLHGKMDGSNEAPGGGNQRNWIRSVFGDILQNVVESTGKPMEMADLQALVWYPEKRLYDSAKADDELEGYEDDEAPDYANAAVALARSKGVSDDAIRDALARPADRPAVVRPVAGPAVARELEQFDTEPEEADGQAEKGLTSFGQRALPAVARGAVTGPVVGVHYSQQPRNTLSSSAFGSGMKGAERDRIAQATDSRIKQRINFYVNTGNGIKPESGVGAYAHTAPLENLYDADADTLKIWRNVSDLNDRESAVLDAGFDGYLTRNFGDTGAVVLLGQRSVPVEQTTEVSGAPVPPAPQYPDAKLQAQRLMNDRSLPAGRLTKSEWQGELTRRGYDTEIVNWSALADGKDYYKSDLAGTVWQDGESDQRRGSFTPANLEIRFLAQADRSTALHELGHFFLHATLEMAARPNAPADIVRDANAILAKAGVADLEAFRALTIAQQTEVHEWFAESWEQYLFTGKAPSTQLESLFSKFTKWMQQVYVDMKNFVTRNPRAKLDPELAQIMDRLIASDEEIAQANDAREYRQLFKDAAEAGMSEAQFAEYLGLSAEQRADAEAMLRTRSLRDLRWTDNKRAQLILKGEQEAKERYAAMRAEVTKELAESPINKARRWLKRGEMLSPAGDLIKVLEGNKLNLDDVKALFPKNALGEPVEIAKLGYGQYGMLAKDGLAPDLVAEMFGFTSGEALVRELLATPSFKEQVQQLTDQRMIDTHGDLNSAESIAKAADEAIHNDARLRSVATELWALNKNVGSVASIIKAAKEYAKQIVGQRTSKTLKPWQFAAAETRAAKAARTALNKGDRDEAAKQVRLEILNAAAAREAYKTEAEVKRITDKWKKIAAYKDDSSAVKTRDAAVVSAVRAVLAEFGIGTKGKSAKEYIELVKAYDPAMGEVITDLVEGATENAKDYRDLTTQQIRDLNDVTQSLWFLAKRARQIEIDGKLIPRAQIEQELYDQLDLIGIPDRLPGEGSAVTAAEKRGMRYDSWLASLRRVESWVGGMDGSKEMGPFRKYVWSQVRDAGDRYRMDKAKYLKQFEQLLKPIAPSLTRQLIEAPELGYTFGKSEGGMGKVELLHALLHTGNKSNLRKLLLGRNWAGENADGSLNTTKWDTFVQRMIDEGRLTKADFDFAQGVWDMLDSMKPAAQKAHRTVYGRFFDEVSADAFTNQFGSYKGGYVPATVDSSVVQDAALRELANQENENLSYAFPTTAKGFTKKRVEYNRPLLLDLRTLTGHIDKVLLFSHLTEPVSDVRRLVMSKRVAGALGRVQPQAIGGILTPWLNRAAKQTLETKIPGRELIGSFWSALRARAGMAAMFANVANSVQQVTGLSLAAVRVKPRLLAAALVEFTTSPKQVSQFVAEHSPYMETRLANEVAMASDHIEQILINPSVYESGKAWTKQHAYFLQSAVDSVIGPVVWLGAYNQALETAPTDLSAEERETYARRLADSAVRETQGSTVPEDVAAFETGSAFYRMFTQFAGYFNMNANLLGTEFTKISREMGLRKGAGRGLYVLTMGLLVPAIVGELIMQLFKGGPDDDNKDGQLWDDWIAQLFGYGLARYMTAMIPVGGTAINALVNTANNKPYDDRMSTAPAVSMIESAIKAPQSVYKAVVADGKPSRAVKDVATLLSMSLGVPASAVARPVSYAADVAAGKVRPTGPVDLARGTITGTASPESKR